MVNHDRLNLIGNNQYIKVYIMRIEKKTNILDLLKELLYSVYNKCDKADPENLNAFLRWGKKSEINIKYHY